ncbi:helix-turn-helix domain-containing protein [Crossiella sp. SN42]|uniref:helix-turn-helix domain-containing protein n=1 Tax=Crossiella sp. SN42 TaxID=2944808 RepID=UPI00207CF302|nr:helix-turn-helix transcriptional regulator [Crossiella sp. SN42]MCO1578322.1 helix-turn-helix domain-containing protein [Crossiella sp. SN42]
MAESPTVRRRHVGAELRRLREAAGQDRESAAELLDCSLSKITKIELGNVAVKKAELEKLLDFYAAPADLSASLLVIAAEAKKRGWWSKYGKAVPDWFRTFVGLESAACEMRVYEAELITGVLQTEAYTRAVIAAVSPELDADQVARLVRVRAERQARLLGGDPQRLNLIMSEAAVRRMVGGPAVMREQLTFLAEVQRRPNVTIQVLPLWSGAHAAIGFTFTMLRFPDEPAPTLVYLEDLTSAVYLDEAADLDVYKLAFDRLQALALGPAESVALMKRAVSEFE